MPSAISTPIPPSPPDPAAPRPRVTAARWAIALLCIPASIAYRLLITDAFMAGFTDDDFLHQLHAQQIVLGDLPVRDFVELGMPLTEALSALAQILFGRSLLPEFLLATTMIGVAAGLLFVLASRASGSMLIGLVPAALLLLIEPRLYNYPKLLTYALAIPIIWRYVDRPTPGRAAAMGAIVALAFLFRHDHGAYIGVAAALTVAVVHWPDRRALARSAVALGTVALVLVSPYLLFVQVHQGIVSYLRGGYGFAARDAARTARGAQQIAMDWAAPLSAFDPDNAVPFLFFLFSVLPYVALGVLVWRWRCMDDDLGRRWHVKVLAVTVLALLVNAGFLRGALGSRLPDVLVPVGILAAWIARRGLAVERRLVQGAVAVFTLALVALSIVAVCALRDIPRRLQANGAIQLAILREHLDGVFARLSAVPPIAAYPDPVSALQLAAYLEACLALGDRVLVAAYTPQLAVFAARGFAGGQHLLRPGFFDSPEDQRLVLARLGTQRVPVVLTVPSEEYEEDYRPAFPLIDEYLAREYRVAAEADPAAGPPLRVLVRRDLPAGGEGPLGLPCFR